MTTALLGLILLTAATVLLGWFYFHHVRMTRPPIGVMTRGDVMVLLAGIVLIPFLYLASVLDREGEFLDAEEIGLAARPVEVEA